MPTHPKKTLAGLSFRIDRPKGYVKSWPGGKSFTYPCDYGYFPGLTGEDGEGLDAFVGDDPNGHFEVFQKLKPREGGGMELDETKFLVGVTDAERETIYRLYGDEIHARRVFRDAEALRAALTKFEPKKKDRYMKTAQYHQWLRGQAARFRKSASEEDDNGLPLDVARMAGAGGLGLLAHDAALGSAERVLGAQRLYHGTSDRAAKGIRRSGMLTRFGGGATGGSAAIKSQTFMDESKGRVHVAKGPLQSLVTHPHAALAEAFARDPKIPVDQAMKAYLKGLLPFSRGSVVEAVVPHESFLRNFEQDPDQLPGVAFRSNKSIPASQVAKGRAGFRDIWKARAKHMPTYLDRHAGRVLRGAALGAGALGLAGGGLALGVPAARRIVERLRAGSGDGEGEGVKEAALAPAYKTVLARYKLSNLKRADIEKLIRGDVVAAPNAMGAENVAKEEQLARAFAEADAKTQPTGEESAAGTLPPGGV